MNYFRRGQQKSAINSEVLSLDVGLNGHVTSIPVTFELRNHEVKSRPLIYRHRSTMAWKFGNALKETCMPLPLKLSVTIWCMCVLVETSSPGCMKKSNRQN